MSTVAHDQNRIADLIERLARLMRASGHAGGLKPVQLEALRYLSRCNRFSNSPGAVAAYLATTKGTVSQTIQALERKGLVSKAVRPGSGNSVAVTLTAAGWAALSRDPWQNLSERAASLGGRDQEALADALSSVLAGLLAENELRTFGICRTCRFFQAGGGRGSGQRSDRCGLLKLDLAPGDADLICAEHTAPAAA